MRTPTQSTAFLQLFDVMLRKIYSISQIRARSKAISSPTYNNLASHPMQVHVVILAGLLIAIFQETAAKELGSEDATDPRDDGRLQHLFGQQRHQLAYVDTKYWVQDTEFGKRENWVDKRMPCTSLERIEVAEEAVVSLGNLLDAIDGMKSLDVRELTLPLNSVLLFDENSNINERTDSNFIKYLNESGNCWYVKESDVADQVFSFAPDSDSMSWFNPENWASSLYDDFFDHLMPDSHRVPCTEDIVIFGDRRFDSATLRTNEQSKLMSFKVNFRSSKRSVQNTSEPSGGYNQQYKNNIRIARLMIGDLRYNQAEFEQLVREYGNTLFDFHDNLSTLEQEYAKDPSILLTIDESSLQLSADNDYSHGRCFDEAGCLCGNEASENLQAICSFNEPIDTGDHPCHDPIPTSGYCNNICATVLAMSIDPTKFSEGFLTSLIDDKLAIRSVISQQYFGDVVFSVTRRALDTRYEITFIHVPIDAENYESSFGVEREFADLIFQSLNNAAVKSFYGIRSMSLRSSKDWKWSNKNELFWASFIIMSLFVVMKDIYGKDSGENWFIFDRTIMTRVNHWMGCRLESRTMASTAIPNSINDEDNTADWNERSGNSGTTAEIALVDLDDRSNIDDKANLISKVD